MTAAGLASQQQFPADLERPIDAVAVKVQPANHHGQFPIAPGPLARASSAKNQRGRTQNARRSWRKNIVYVPQHIYIADDTIDKNVAFGAPESEIDFEAVERAARISNLSDFIESELPARHNIEVEAQGIRLGGGQRQRIGMA